MDFTVEIVSRNRATISNFVEFRDSRNFTYFKAKRMNGSVTCGSGLLNLQHAGLPRGCMQEEQVSLDGGNGMVTHVTKDFFCIE